MDLGMGNGGSITNMENTRSNCGWERREIFSPVRKSQGAVVFRDFPKELEVLIEYFKITEVRKI